MRSVPDSSWRNYWTSLSNSFRLKSILESKILRCNSRIRIRRPGKDHKTFGLINLSIINEPTTRWTAISYSTSVLLQGKQFDCESMKLGITLRMDKLTLTFLFPAVLQAINEKHLRCQCAKQQFENSLQLLNGIQPRNSWYSRLLEHPKELSDNVDILAVYPDSPKMTLVFWFITWSIVDW